MLVGDEPYLPYQRPPLSKKFLAGELAADRLLFRHQTYYDEHRVELRLGRPVLKIDTGRRAARRSRTESASTTTGCCSASAPARGL